MYRDSCLVEEDVNQQIRPKDRQMSRERKNVYGTEPERAPYISMAYVDGAQFNMFIFFRFLFRDDVESYMTSGTHLLYRA